MRKYISILLVFAFIFSFFTTNINSVSALTVASGDCMAGDLFSRTTGQRCITSTTPAECRPGDLFSSVTGKPCGPTTSPVSRYCTLPVFQIGEKGEAVKTFQTELNAEGANLKVDGSYGPKTEAAMSIYCKYPYPNSSSVVISGVKGPQSLEVNQEGTWNVVASDSNGGSLSYSVIWGDERSNANLSVAAENNFNFKQSASFTHSYSQAGIYNPTFIVSSENTIRCIQAPCPSNGGSAQTSLSVKVGNDINKRGTLYIEPSSLSVNIGENAGVKAYYQPPMPICSPGFACIQVMPMPIEVDASWSSSNSNVATVERIGASCLGCKSYPVVRGVSLGTAIITATYGEISPASAKITVKNNNFVY